MKCWRKELIVTLKKTKVHEKLTRLKVDRPQETYDLRPGVLKEVPWEMVKAPVSISQNSIHSGHALSWIRGKQIWPCYFIKERENGKLRILLLECLGYNLIVDLLINKKPTDYNWSV